MNELKFPFKFKHYTELSFVYDARLVGQDTVEVIWKDEDGRTDSDFYTLLDAVNYVTRGRWIIITELTPQKDERDEYIAELEAQVENLEELITMLSQEDESQKQRAEVYDMLSGAMIKHPSFKDMNGSSRATELMEQLDVLFKVYDSNSNQNFKPISEMTLEDWQQACEEEWVFDVRNGECHKVKSISHAVGDSYPVELTDCSLTLQGKVWDHTESDLDIIRRIK